MELLTHIPVTLDAGRIITRFRMTEGSDEHKWVEELVERASELARPKALYDACYVDDRGDSWVEVAGVRLESRVLAVNLKDAHRVFPHVVTCGSELDAIPPVSDDPMEPYWLDEIRLMALSAARQALREDVDKRYRPGPLSAMAPGSLEDWPLAQQEGLFSILGDVAGLIGVTLTDSFLMVPMKSTSGILFPTEIRFESCQLCPRETCAGRRAPYDEQLWEKYQ